MNGDVSFAYWTFRNPPFWRAHFFLLPFSYWFVGRFFFNMLNMSPLSDMYTENIFFSVSCCLFHFFFTLIEMKISILYLPICCLFRININGYSVKVTCLNYWNKSQLIFWSWFLQLCKKKNIFFRILQVSSQSCYAPTHHRLAAAPGTLQPCSQPCWASSTHQGQQPLYRAGPSSQLD